MVNSSELGEGLGLGKVPCGRAADVASPRVSCSPGTSPFSLLCPCQGADMEPMMVQQGRARLHHLLCDFQTSWDS